jgi:hypothetical protein
MTEPAPERPSRARAASHTPAQAELAPDHGRGSAPSATRPSVTRELAKAQGTPPDAMARHPWAPATPHAPGGPLTRRRLFAPLALALAVWAGFSPWFPKLASPNELTRVYLAEALARDGTVCIDGPIARHGPVFDASEREVDGVKRRYSDKAPGLAFVALPGVAAARALGHDDLPTLVRLTRLLGATLPALLLLALLARHLPRWLPGPRGADLAPALLVALAVASPLAAYGGLAYGHALSATVLFALYDRLAALAPDRAAPRQPPRAGALAAVGALAGLAVLVEYQNALLLLPFAVAFAVRTRLAPRAVGLALLGALPPGLAFGLYHEAAFGSPFLTGYSFIATSFAAVHAQGLLGVSLPRLDHAWLGFFSTQKGLFFFAPWLLLGLVALPSLLRARATPPSDAPASPASGPVPDLASRRLVAAFLLLIALFVSAMVYPAGGWTLSQRHLTPALPFMTLAVAAALSRLIYRFPAIDAVFAGLALPALVTCGLSALLWPHWQEDLENPAWQLGPRLLADGWVPPSLLSPLVPSRPLILGLLGLAALAVSAPLWRRDPREPALPALRLAAALLVATAVAAWASLPGASDPDLARERRFIEEAYVADPRATPVPASR